MATIAAGAFLVRQLPCIERKRETVAQQQKHNTRQALTLCLHHKAGQAGQVDDGASGELNVVGEEFGEPARILHNHVGSKADEEEHPFLILSPTHVECDMRHTWHILHHVPSITLGMFRLLESRFARVLCQILDQLLPADSSMSPSSQLLIHGPSAALAWHSRVQHAGLWLAGDLLHPAAQGVLKGMPHLPDPQIPAGQRRGRHSTNRGRRCYSLRRFVVRHIETRGETSRRRETRWHLLQRDTAQSPNMHSGELPLVRPRRRG